MQCCVENSEQCIVLAGVVVVVVVVVGIAAEPQETYNLVREELLFLARGKKRRGGCNEEVWGAY
ncbi:hypothetical protein E2C01_093387 [Portunus trituberculatus]|uniref:Uncharacterized protein n=1 Tax=Portunus trituberculatus TaxID=210409 RepID=A0A5B7JY57_PORTR|nr:hypothetical protein [Portunus trituberculatus]